jgi:hypothetical protein
MTSEKDFAGCPAGPPGPSGARRAIAVSDCGRPPDQGPTPYNLQPKRCACLISYRPAPSHIAGATKSTRRRGAAGGCRRILLRCLLLVGCWFSGKALGCRPRPGGRYGDRQDPLGNRLGSVPRAVPFVIQAAGEGGADRAALRRRASVPGRAAAAAGGGCGGTDRRGGMKLVAQATGAHPDTTARRAQRELEGGPGLPGRTRAPGGRRKKLADSDPGLVPALMDLVDPATREDPEPPLHWTTKFQLSPGGRAGGGRACSS